MPWLHGIRQTITGMLSEAARTWGTRPCLDICDDAVYSFRDIEERSNQIARGLIAAGVKRGDSVCTMLDNHIDHVLCFFAVLKTGALYVPLNTALRGEFLAHQLADSEASTIIIEAELVSRLVAVRPGTPKLRTVIHRGETTEPAGEQDFRPLEQIPAASAEPLDGDIKPADTSMLLYTSGTTGPSKACIISHNYVCQYTRDLCYMCDIQFEDALYTSNPLFHINAIGMMLTAIHKGSRTIIDRRFSVSQFWPEIKRSGATMASLLGAMIPLLANAEESVAAKACFGQLRRVAGSPFTEDTERKWKERFGVKVARNVGYGMTEVCPAFIAPPHGDHPAGSSGRRAEHVDARIFGEDGQECPPGVPGEVVVRPRHPNVMFEGYWNRAEDTLRVYDGLWFHTGDIGMIDADGYFYFVDRKKDYLRRSGENISSFEMEATLLSHPGVAQVAVHAVPSNLAEDEVKVTAVLQPGATVSEEELCRWTAEHVPYFAVPRFIEFRDALPSNSSGRVLKYALRDEGVTTNTWDRERSDFRVVKR